MAEADEPKKGHTLADHSFGEELYHVHDGDADHDHDHDYFETDQPLEENPLWIQDHVTLHSVGIDIGSAGTQVIFSRLNLRRLGEDLSSRYYVVSRETLFQSPVALTPYQSEERIDDAALGGIIDQAYEAARLHPDNIDTGGGTTKLGLVEQGRVIATAAVHIGGRLQVVDEHGKIVRLDPAGRYHAAE